MVGDVILFVENSVSDSGKYMCRICHEEEFQSCERFEAPCDCSGTVKYAHRECIQRWCDEKGNTTCEICLQKFEPGYAASPQNIKLADTVVVTIIRENSGIQRREREVENQESMERQSSDTRDSERASSWWRSVTLIFTVVMLFRHVIAVLNGGASHYPFTLPTLIMIEATGIILPMYILVWIITSFQNSVKLQAQKMENEE